MQVTRPATKTATGPAPRAGAGLAGNGRPLPAFGPATTRSCPAAGNIGGNMQVEQASGYEGRAERGEAAIQSCRRCAIIRWIASASLALGVAMTGLAPSNGAPP